MWSNTVFRVWHITTISAQLSVLLVSNQTYIKAWTTIKEMSALLG